MKGIIQILSQKAWGFQINHNLQFKQILLGIIMQAIATFSTSWFKNIDYNITP